MFKLIPDIIKSVGASKKKMITMVILLLCFTGIIVFNKLIFKDNCGDLIKQNETLVNKNFVLIGMNEKMIDNNNSIMGKYADLQKKFYELEPETIYVVKDRMVAYNETRVNTENVETEEYTVAPKPIQVERVERMVRVESAIEYVSDSLVSDTTLLEIKTDTLVTEKIPRRGFFKRLFGKK